MRTEAIWNRCLFCVNRLTEFYWVALSFGIYGTGWDRQDNEKFEQLIKFEENNQWNVHLKVNKVHAVLNQLIVKTLAQNRLF